jgi:hypothetical protein
MQKPLLEQTKNQNAQKEVMMMQPPIRISIYEGENCMIEDEYTLPAAIDALEEYLLRLRTAEEP